MKQILRSVVFLALTVALIFGMDRLYTRLIQQDDYNKVWWLAKMKNKKYDFAFLGASRAYTMVKTPFLEKKWDAKGINLALDGSNPMQQYLILKQYVDNGNKLNDLFLVLDVVKMNYELNSDYRVWCFLPYIHENEDIYREFSRVYGADTAFAWRYVPFYRYAKFNSKLGLLTVTNSLVKAVKTPFNDNGDFKKPYVTLMDTADGTTEPFTATVLPIQMDYLEKMLAICQQNGIRMHIYTPPFFYPRFAACRNTNQIIDEYIQPLCSKYGADYKSFCDIPVAHNWRNFADPLHLNQNGIDQYMDTLAGTYVHIYKPLSERSVVASR